MRAKAATPNTEEDHEDMGHSYIVCLRQFGVDARLRPVTIEAEEVITNEVRKKLLAAVVRLIMRGRKQGNYDHGGGNGDSNEIR